MTAATATARRSLGAVDGVESKSKSKSVGRSVFVMTRRAAVL